MNADDTMNPRTLLRKSTPQLPSNILSMHHALTLAARPREPAQSQSKPKNNGATPPPMCGRCGKKGHIVTEIDDNGMYKCPTRRAESLLPAAELERRRAQASAEIEAIEKSPSQSATGMPSHSPTATSSLPEDSFNRNWRIPSLTPQRQWNQPKPPQKREQYIESLESENLELPIWRVNYFKLYMSLQTGSSLEGYPYQAGRMHMAKLHSTNLKLMRNAKAKSRVQKENINKRVVK